MLLNKKRGFTLIELLVVIAIIAILAAILFPVFARAREKARTASCQSNQKEICLGFKMYTSDYDEKFPGGTQPVAASIFPYIKNVQIYHCPSDSNLPTSGDLGAASSVSYGYNSLVATVSEAQLESVATTILTGDAESYSDFRDITSTTDPHLIPENERHSEGANYSFCDGHAKWLRLSQIEPGAAFSTSRACVGDH